MLSSVIPVMPSTSKYGQSSSSSSSGKSQMYASQPHSRFSVRVFKGPSFSGFGNISTSASKIDPAYRPSNLPDTLQSGYPSRYDNDPSKRYSLSTSTELSKSTRSNSTAVNNPAAYQQPAPPIPRPPSSSYAIYPNAAGGTYIYQQSLSSKSDIYSNDEDTASMVTFSPSSIFSPALSTDSTLTLKSDVPTSDIDSSSQGQLTRTLSNSQPSEDFRFRLSAQAQQQQQFPPNPHPMYMMPTSGIGGEMYSEPEEYEADVDEVARVNALYNAASSSASFFSANASVSTEQCGTASGDGSSMPASQVVGTSRTTNSAPAMAGFGDHVSSSTNNRSTQAQYSFSGSRLSGGSDQFIPPLGELDNFAFPTNSRPSERVGTSPTSASQQPSRIPNYPSYDFPTSLPSNASAHGGYTSSSIPSAQNNTSLRPDRPLPVPPPPGVARQSSSRQDQRLYVGGPRMDQGSMRPHTPYVVPPSRQEETARSRSPSVERSPPVNLLGGYFEGPHVPPQVPAPTTASRNPSYYSSSTPNERQPDIVRENSRTPAPGATSPTDYSQPSSRIRRNSYLPEDSSVAKEPQSRASKYLPENQQSSEKLTSSPPSYLTPAYRTDSPNDMKSQSSSQSSEQSQSGQRQRRVSFSSSRPAEVTPRSHLASHQTSPNYEWPGSENEKPTRIGDSSRLPAEVVDNGRQPESRSPPAASAGVRRRDSMIRETPVPTQRQSNSSGLRTGGSYLAALPEPQPRVIHPEPMRRNSDGDRPPIHVPILPPGVSLSDSSAHPSMASARNSIVQAPSSVHSEPQRRYSDGDQFPTRASTSGRISAPLCRNVRWNENLICPSPIFANQRRKGWFNRRGDQLWTNEGAYKPAPPGQEYPPDLDEYPEYGEGWMNEECVRINMGHRLIPKVPLRSALKQVK